MAETNARTCNLCGNRSCPFPSDQDYSRQRQVGGAEWIVNRPCWVPIAGNVGKIHDRQGNFTQRKGGLQVVVDAIHVGILGRRGMVGVLRYSPRHWGLAHRMAARLKLRTFGPFIWG